jgi:signal transduction histidine kinase/ActR/RegA family two-component response regulator
VRHPVDTQETVIDRPEAVVVVVGGASVGRKFPVGKRAVIGRGDEAGAQLSDPEVSRAHAEIRWEPTSEFVINDLDSRNGTRVNGAPIVHAVLRFGDKIQVGSSTLLFLPHDPVEEELLQRQRLELLGRLSAGIAHDVNNMLSAVIGNLEHVRTTAAAGAAFDREACECIEDALAAAARAAALAPRLLAFAHPSRHGHSNIDAGAICAEVARIARHTFSRRIRVHLDLEPELFVMGDSVEIHQVLMNLCLNARDAMPTGGRLAVRARPGDAAARKEVILEVSDDGVGMDEATRRRIFEPFFTTKQGRGGFGIGLATTREIVTVHGGVIEVESAPGRGTTFRVRLPASVGPSVAREAVATIGVRPARALDARTVLVVDDEALVRRALVRLVQGAGFGVLEAASGAEALAFYLRDHPRPDVVLLDLELPDVEGEKLLADVLALDREARVVALGPHADEARARALRQAGALGFVAKPADQRTLVTALEGALALAALPPRPPLADEPTHRKRPDEPEEP